MIKDIFETRGNSIYCNHNMNLTLEKTNVEFLDDGNLSVMLFGSVVVITDTPNFENHVITLGSKVIIPIYNKDQISNRDDDSDYIMISFYKGDKFIEDTHIPQTIDNVAVLFKTFTGGHLSKYIPYGRYYDIIKNNIEINLGNGPEKGSIMFPKILLELLIGEMFINDHGEKLRRTNDDVGIPASVDDIIQTSGTFNSMIHEDPDKAILLNKVKTDSQQIQPSVLEEFFRK